MTRAEDEGKLRDLEARWLASVTHSSEYALHIRHPRPVKVDVVRFEPGWPAGGKYHLDAGREYDQHLWPAVVSDVMTALSYPDQKWSMNKPGVLEHASPCTRYHVNAVDEMLAHASQMYALLVEHLEQEGYVVWDETPRTVKAFEEKAAAQLAGEFGELIRSQYQVELDRLVAEHPHGLLGWAHDVKDNLWRHH